jgi:hypothetical protein
MREFPEVLLTSLHTGTPGSSAGPRRGVSGGELDPQISTGNVRHSLTAIAFIDCSCWQKQHCWQQTYSHMKTEGKRGMQTSFLRSFERCVLRRTQYLATPTRLSYLALTCFWTTTAVCGCWKSTAPPPSRSTHPWTGWLYCMQPGCVFVCVYICVCGV